MLGQTSVQDKSCPDIYPNLSDIITSIRCWRLLYLAVQTEIAFLKVDGFKFDDMQFFQCNSKYTEIYLTNL